MEVLSSRPGRVRSFLSSFRRITPEGPARAGHRLRRARGREPQPRDPRLERRLHRDAPERHGRRATRARCDRGNDPAQRLDARHQLRDRQLGAKLLRALEDRYLAHVPGVPSDHATGHAPDFEEDELYPAEEPWFALAYRFEHEFARAYAAAVREAERTQRQAERAAAQAARASVAQAKEAEREAKRLHEAARLATSSRLPPSDAPHQGLPSPLRLTFAGALLLGAARWRGPPSESPRRSGDGRSPAMELIARARTGDRFATEALLQRCLPPLRRWADRSRDGESQLKLKRHLIAL